MIKTYFTSVSKARSLTAKIREAEQHLLIRQGEAGVRTDALIKKIHQQVTAPSTLLMTAGIGYILGELTQRRTAGNGGADGKQRTIGSFPLRTALNLIAPIHTLYMALPAAWKARIFQSSSRPDRKAQPVPAPGNRQGS